MPTKAVHIRKDTSSTPHRVDQAQAGGHARDDAYPISRAALAAALPPAASAADLLSLQHAVGNRAVNRLLEQTVPAGERSPAIRRLDQSLPFIGPALSYLNPVNQAMRAVLPGLSPAQKSLLDGIFGASLATSLIRLNRNSVLSTGNCYRTTGNIINMPGDTISDRHLIHEAAHTWQSQNTLFGVGYAVSALRAQALAQILGGDWQRAYDYANLERNRVPWRYWNAEQQAHWIEDNRRLPNGWLLEGQLPTAGFESTGLE